VKLGSRAASLENRASMALMLAFYCRLEKTTNNVEAHVENHPSTRSHEIQQRHLLSILHYMDECESEVLRSDSFYHVIPFSLCGNAREYIEGFRSVIACCKCHIQQLLGNTVVAVQLAQQAVQLAHGASCTPYVPVITGLAHVVKFLHEHDSPGLVDGIKLLRTYLRSLSHSPYSSLSCDPSDPLTTTNPDQLTDGDLYNIQTLCTLPSPLSFSPLSFLRTYSLVDDNQNSDDDLRCPSLSPLHYSTQGCGILYEPTLPMDPLFMTDPMVVDELLELKQTIEHRCAFEDGGSGGNGGVERGEGQSGEGGW